jgi:hypothetical protein
MQINKLCGNERVPVCVSLESFNPEPAATAGLAASGRRRWLRVKQPALQLRICTLAQLWARPLDGNSFSWLLLSATERLTRENATGE